MTTRNENFRDTLWTGRYLQMTVMSIPAGGEIGAEIQDDHDQFIRPAGSWHNRVNEGDEPVKLYSICTAPDHVHGTVHYTREEADNDPDERE